MTDSPKVMVVLPAYNAASTLERTLFDIPHDFVDEILLVDDCSRDHTYTLAEELGRQHPRLSLEGTPGATKLTLVRHERNTGYGGNQKTCYTYALDQNADIVVMVHPDYQYDPRRIVALCEPLIDGSQDVMLGSRIRNWRESKDGGMPLYKYVSNRGLTTVQNLVTGRRLSEWHTGMRAYTRQVLSELPFHRFSDDFVFDTQMLMGMVRKGYRIGEIPVEVRYFEEAPSINFKRSAEYGLRTLYYTFGYGAERFRQVFYYLFAGGTGYVVNIGLYTILITRFGVWYPRAAAIAVVAGLCTSFVLQKLFTFRSKGTSVRIGYEAVLYALVGAINMLIVTRLVIWGVEWLHIGKIGSAFLANALAAVWSFFIYKYFIFTNRSRT